MEALKQKEISLKIANRRLEKEMNRGNLEAFRQYSINIQKIEVTRNRLKGEFGRKMAGDTIVYVARRNQTANLTTI